MEAIFLRLANLAVNGGFVVLVLLLVRPLLRRAPKWLNCLLWVVAAARLLIPAAISTPIGLLRTSAPVMQAKDGAVWLLSHIPVLDWYGSAIQYRLFYEHGLKAANVHHVLHTLVVLWMIGTAALLLYGAVSAILLRRRVAESVPLEGWKDVRLCDNIPSPFLLGLARPVIYLPSGLEPDERQHVIAHEMAHLRRKDHWWKALGFLLLALFWPNPLLWLGYSRFCRDLELACDESVVRDLAPSERRAYAETLLRCSAQPGALSAPLAFGETGVKQRIRALAKYRQPARWVTALAAVLCLLLGVCLATNYQAPAFRPDQVILSTNLPTIRVKDPEIAAELYDAFLAAEPIPYEAHARAQLEITFRDEDEGLTLSLYPNGTVLYFPRDVYAEERVAARDDGALYRLASALIDDAPDPDSNAVNAVLREAVLAAHPAPPGTDLRCEDHSIHGVQRVRAGVWRVCVHDLIWDATEYQPEKWTVPHVSNTLEVFELTRQEDGGWAAEPVLNALEPFEADLVNLRATEEEQTNTLEMYCQQELFDALPDYWNQFTGYPNEPPMEER